MASETGSRTTRKLGVPNGSEPRVPNRSEPVESIRRALGVDGAASNDGTGSSGPPLSAGRPPVLDDSELDALAQRLSRQLGRPPRLHELTEAAGGCQRQRASRAVQRLRLGIAEKAVRSQIVLPPQLEVELRAWVERWLQVAALQMREVHAEFEQRHEETLLDAQDLLSEQTAQLTHMRERLEDQARMTGELLAANKTLQAQIAQARAERDIANAVSEELRGVIDTLKGEGPGPGGAQGGRG
jgi:hypothetical protein